MQLTTLFDLVVMPCFSEIQPGQSVEVNEVTESCKRNRVCLKGIISTPTTYEGTLLATLNMRLRYKQYVINMC